MGRDEAMGGVGVGVGTEADNPRLKRAIGDRKEAQTLRSRVT